jgi:hypothetical protein
LWGRRLEHGLPDDLLDGQVEDLLQGTAAATRIRDTERVAPPWEGT